MEFICVCEKYGRSGLLLNEKFWKRSDIPEIHLFPDSGFVCGEGEIDNENIEKYFITPDEYHLGSRNKIDRDRGIVRSKAWGEMPIKDFVEQYSDLARKNA